MRIRDTFLMFIINNNARMSNHFFFSFPFFAICFIGTGYMFLDQKITIENKYINKYIIHS